MSSMSKPFELPAFVHHYLKISPSLEPLAENDFERFVVYWMYCTRGGRLTDFSKELLTHAWGADENIVQDQFMPITRMMAVFYRLRPDLAAHFNLQTPEGRFGFINWYLSEGDRALFRRNVFSVKFADPLESGVNLLGFAASSFGLGEMLRLSRASLDQVGIKTTIIDTNHDRVGDLKYKVNLVCLPGMENYRLTFNFDLPVFERTYNIGYWPWELSRWPEELKFCFDCCQEVWALSEFNREALQKSTDKPVTRMPIAIEEPKLTTKKRADFGLKEDFFYFLNIFDFHSYIERKNPLGAIKAFQAAFPKTEAGNSKVGLVFKTLNLDPGQPECQAFLKLIGDDSRIKVINQEFSKPELATLMSLTDAYLSLHRAEGFGLPIAEAMLLEKPVICTAYSGNMDFTRPDNSYLVDFKLIPVAPGAYHFMAPESEWADASVTDAAAKMREVFENKEETRARAARGKLLILNEYSPQKVGQMMQERLKNIPLLS